MRVEVKSRWFMFFALATLTFGLVGACWIGWNVHQVSERKKMTELLVARGAEFTGWAYHRKSLPVLWSALGANEFGDDFHGFNIITMPTEKFSDQEVEIAKTLFPEMSVWRGPGLPANMRGGQADRQPPH